MKRYFFRLAVIVSITFVSSLYSQTEAPKQEGPSNQQKQPEYVFRSTTRLVVLDVVATDAQGHTVSDLKPEEVQIFENGKEQTKKDFNFFSPNPEQAAQLVNLHLPPDVYTNAQQYRGNSSYNIILIDVLNSSFTDLAYAHDELIKYFDTTPPSQPTAIFALGNKLWMLHDFTTDQQALKESIRKFKGQGSQLVTTSGDDQNTYKHKSTFTTMGADRVGATLDAFRAMARIMGAYKGRKNLIWISESFAVDTMPDMQPKRGPLFMDEYSREVEQMSDTLMEAQIAIYPVDPAGLSGDAFTPMLHNYSEQGSLREMAERTGGKAFINRNDLDIGIRDSIDDGSSYYTTSYTPASKTWDGRMRKIEVKTTRPGVKLRYRQGYFAVDPAMFQGTKKEVKQTSIDFAQALDPDLAASTGLLFQAQVLPPSAATHDKVHVQFAVDPHSIVFNRTEDGLEHAKVSCIAWAFPVKGKPIGSGGGTVNTALNPETFQKVMKSALPCSQSVDLIPGNYMLRLGVIDQASKRIGALTAWVTVPDSAVSSAQVSGPNQPVPPEKRKE